MPSPMSPPMKASQPMREMQIVKVVVRGELPKSCADCKCFSMCYEEGKHCGATGEEIAYDSNWASQRMPWCPLQLEDKENEE